MPAYDCDCHGAARAEVRILKNAGRVNELGILIAVIDGVLNSGHANGQPADHPVKVQNGVGIFELCCSQLFAYYVLIDPARPGARPILKILAVNETQKDGLADAKQRV